MSLMRVAILMPLTTRLVGRSWRLTAGRVGGLHESLLEVDPDGIEAADFC